MRCRNCGKPIEKTSITREGFTCPACGTTRTFTLPKKTTKATKTCICGCKGRKAPHKKNGDGDLVCGSCGRKISNAKKGVPA